MANDQWHMSLVIGHLSYVISEVLHVVLQDTAVHHHFQPRRSSAGGGRLIHHSQLHPNDAGIAAYGSFDHVGNIFRTAEDVDDFEGFWYGIE